MALVDVLVFGAVFLLARELLSGPARLRPVSAVGRRLRQWKDTARLEPGARAETEEQLSFYDRIVRPAMRRVGRLVRRSEKEHSRVQAMIIKAGYQETVEPIDIFAMQLVFALIGIGVCAVLLISPNTRSLGLMLMMFAGLLGWRLPPSSLRSRSERRQKVFQRSLPDVLDLLAVSVEAGLSFDQAVGQVAEEFGGPVKQEVEQILMDMKVGRSRADALRRLAQRVDTWEVKAFVAAVIQAETLGTSIGHVLKVQAKSVRIKRRQTAQEDAAKMPIKLLFPTITLVFPTVFIVILTPAAIQMMTLFKG